MSPALYLLPLLAVFAQQGTFGELRTHDPSRVVKGQDGNYIYFCTGPLMPMRYSKDFVHWQGKNGVMTDIPQWAHEHVPKGNKWIWAPDIIFDKAIKKWVVFFSYSTFGSRRSAIGTLTSPDLKIDSTWTDAGMVIASDESSNYNCIDACPIYDEKGALWMTFGSWNTGIKLVQLDPKTLKANSELFSLAGSDQTDMEASFLWHKGDYYYLFFNRGFCCRGVNSTYKILMGRSKKITGPYLDREGKDCFGKDGGSLVLETNGDFIGPGQTGITADGKTFTFHYYNKQENGAPTFGHAQIKMDQDGWPVVYNLQ